MTAPHRADLGPLFEQPEPRLGRTLKAIRDICALSWFTLAEIRERLALRGIFISEAAISARVRQLRGLGYTAPVRLRAGHGKLFETHIEWAAEVGAAQQGVA